MPYIVYILLSRDNRYYIGITTDLERRLMAHKSGRGAKFTRSFGVMKVMYQEVHPNKSAALKREAQLKKLSRREKQALVRLF